jgi:hypothetical protein
LIIQWFTGRRSQELSKQFGHWVKGGVLKERRGRSLGPGMRRWCDLLLEMLHQARFANPGLADDQYRLTLTLKRAFPAIHQQT